MSLKAKIEAVIYASEEPVTLAQLVGLLGDEAQAELDRSVSAQQTLSLNELEGGADAGGRSSMRRLAKHRRTHAADESGYGHAAGKRHRAITSTHGDETAMNEDTRS